MRSEEEEEKKKEEEDSVGGSDDEGGKQRKWERMCFGFWGKWVVISRGNRGIFNFHYAALRVATKLALAVPKAQGFASLFITFL